ncbi:MAG: hypothetical protein KJ060_02820, partial [Candidatus Hydrogenedentes bacterium]|nr:hypothetical protein [Candidatus Hydrogenedentota bacterium]
GVATIDGIFSRVTVQSERHSFAETNEYSFPRVNSACMRTGFPANAKKTTHYAKLHDTVVTRRATQTPPSGSEQESADSPNRRVGCLIDRKSHHTVHSSGDPS